MGGAIDWAALPVVIDLLGIKDIEGLIAQLIALRDFLRDNPETR
jgi:hypothetical protein